MWYNIGSVVFIIVVICTDAFFLLTLLLFCGYISLGNCCEPCDGVSLRYSEKVC